MKKWYCCFIIFSVFQQVEAQKMPVDFYEEALELYNSKDYSGAITSLVHIMDSCPDFEEYAEAKYDLGLAYYQLKQYNNSIRIFKEMLDSSVRERVYSDVGIMDNPYSNFKSYSVRMISNIYFEMEKYDSSLYYLNLASDKYVYEHYCGNAIMDVKSGTTLRYAEIFKKMERWDDYEESLLSLVFMEGEYNIRALHLLKEYYATNFKKEKLLKDAEKAFGKIQEVDGNYAKQYFITFHKVNILVSGGPSDFTETIGPVSKKELLESQFYTMLKNL